VRAQPAFLALTGPTASGKTALSLAVARRLDVEIVSMDSRQVYRGMDVGTAKATPEERSAVPHHGLDLVDPDERYSAGRFARDARQWIAEIQARGRVPILVGGTGFFLRAVLDPIFAEPKLDEARRDALRRWLRGVPLERLAAWVRRLDPERADVAVQGGRQRMGRTLEVALLSGRPLSRWHREAPPDGEPLAGVVVLLDVPRDELHRRIEARAAHMMRTGLLEEVRSLRARGFGDDAPGMTGTGYREAAACLAGEATLEEAVREIARSTRRYARRQRTWFRNQLPPDTRRVDGTEPLETQVELVLDAWRSAGGRPPRPSGSTHDRKQATKVTTMEERR
jgi:tRNA dimethylallyltransferase